MSDLYITSAQPNPTGKDRPPHGGPPPWQLNQEWVQFKNATQNILNLHSLCLHHYIFEGQCQENGETKIMTFSGQLSPGHSIRVHTGSGQPDTDGSLHHLYLNRGQYVWNNACGDYVVLRLTDGALIDWAHYAPKPPEGILHRVQNTNDLR